MLSVYLFSIYGVRYLTNLFISLNKGDLVFEEKLIKNEWHLHFMSQPLVLIGILYLLKDKIDKLYFSIDLGVFGTRFISQMVDSTNKAYEMWYEMPLMIIITVIIHKWISKK